MDFPTIFDLLDRVGLFRGLPGVVVLLLATFLIVAAWDMRLSLPALLSHYLIAGLLFVDVLDPRLAVVYALAGIFVTAILAITAWQVNWGRPPLGLTAQEAKRLNLPSRRTFGRVSIPNRSLVRLVLAGVVLVLALWLASTPSTLLPVIPDELAYLEPAIAGLMGLGLVGATTSVEPLPSGLGLLVAMTGFELFYSLLDQSIAMTLALAAANLVIALVISYLAQARYLPADILDGNVDRIPSCHACWSGGRGRRCDDRARPPQGCSNGRAGYCGAADGPSGTGKPGPGALLR